MRSPRLEPWFLVAVLAAGAGCVGQPSPGGGGTPDASGGGGKDGGVADAPMLDAPAPFTCRDKLTTGIDNGHHNAGQDCQQSCHNHGFFLSGTLYTSAAGGQAVAGASITFVDANGVTGDMHTGLNGNFWWSLEVAFPVTVIASSCPDIQKMTATVPATGAGCNKTGCHVSGAAGRAHLP